MYNQRGVYSVKKLCALALILVLVLNCLTGCFFVTIRYSDSVTKVSDYENSPYIVLNNNTPEFTEEDYTTESYEYYSRLDRYGRCGYAMACISTDLMPTEERESIGQIKPSGWVNNSYEFVDGKYLYNRCHLIGFQLTGENANEQNLITGTRYMNTEGMLPFENMVADYIKETGNHVLYRVTPVYDGENLVARGVQMEAWSVEDDGTGICFNVYCYNIQPGVEINYTTGENWASIGGQNNEVVIYILNNNSGKFHLADCGQTRSISAENKQEYTGKRQDLIEQGYSPAGCCNP